MVVHSHVEWSFPQRYSGQVLHIAGLGGREQHGLPLLWVGSGGRGGRGKGGGKDARGKEGGTNGCDSAMSEVT